MNHNLILGLGNPGLKYTNTRHNIGWNVLDSLLNDIALSWSIDKNSEYSRLKLEESIFHFLKPQEYMNLSGKETVRIVKMFKIPIDSILVIHDEIDLPFGRIKNKKGGGTAGHNGLADIVERLGSNDFYRIRFGVGKPNFPGKDIADYVLEKFTEEEFKSLPQLIVESKERIREWIQKRQ